MLHEDSRIPLKKAPCIHCSCWLITTVLLLYWYFQSVTHLEIKKYIFLFPDKIYWDLKICFDRIRTFGLLILECFTNSVAFFQLKTVKRFEKLIQCETSLWAYNKDLKCLCLLFLYLLGIGYPHVSSLVVRKYSFQSIFSFSFQL